MDFEHTNDQDGQGDNQEPMPRPDSQCRGPVRPPYLRAEQPVAKKSGWRFFWRILFVLSVLTNALLILVLLSVSFTMLIGQPDMLSENTVKDGSASKKIVILRLEGVITSETSTYFAQQLDAVRQDSSVRAVIIRTITPGGSVSASDQIHHEISMFRKETGIPVVAFMQSVAASGGYYTSVACNAIVAEPTVITGSIGVIMNHIVIKDLLQEKLGIEPVVIKSGLKKDWPSPFATTTDEQKEYLYTNLVGPAYDRFVKLVYEGRQQLMTPEEVKSAADGSIFTADQALKKNLIDYIGYTETAISTAESLAGIKNARVVEYTKPFSLANLLGAESKARFKLDRNSIHELTGPQLQYIWNPGL